MEPAATTSLAMLLSLVGISVSNSHCTLNAEQLVQLGKHLRMLHPANAEVAFLSGGLLEDTTSTMVQTANPWHDLSFLAIAGPKGALTLLAGQAGAHYRTYLVTDADQVDRAILVLSQYIGSIYQEHTRCDKATQSSFIAKLIVTLLAEPVFRTINLAALLPTEAGWIDIARELMDQTDSASAFKLLAIKQFLRDNGCTRALVGIIEDNQSLRIIDADDSVAPGTLPVHEGILANVLQHRRLASAPPRRNPSGTPTTDAAVAWANNDALTALPLIRDNRIWGLLLVASAHPMTAKARADLHSLGVLLATYVHEAPWLTDPFAALDTSDVNLIGQSTTLALPQTVRSLNGTGEQLANKRQQYQRDIAVSPMLLDHLSDGVIITDARGRVVACNQKAMQWFKLSNGIIGGFLIDYDNWGLASLLSSALMGEHQALHMTELPNGQLARTTVVEAGLELWAFVVQAPSGHA
ncbi:MAG: PAS domain-containing protein [Chloroflexales bacterium]|nr:PAS domain-containing protein [Chloroflexales bacterium]